MTDLRHRLANLLSHVQHQPGLVDVQIVDFSLRLIYRFIKGRLYEKPLTILDPLLEEAYHQQQIITLTHADRVQSPYQQQLFAHQYLHGYPMKQGLVLFLQNDFQPLLDSVPLLVSAIEALLAAASDVERANVFEDWLLRSGMNQQSGQEAYQGYFYTPHRSPVYRADKDGCYPPQSLPAFTKNDSIMLLSIRPELVAKVVSLSPYPVVRFGQTFLIHVPSIDKRHLNKLAKALQSVLDEPFSEGHMSIIQGSLTTDLDSAMIAMQSSPSLYYPPQKDDVIHDVAVAMAQVKRYRVRNGAHQWIMTYLKTPLMSLDCERQVLMALLKEKTPTFRLIGLSHQLTTHADTLNWMNKHKMAQYMHKTGFIVNQSEEALTTYLRQKSGTIGCSSWDVYMTSPRDYLMLTRSLSESDTSLLEWLFERQMKENVIPIVPVRTTQDILVLTNRQLGYYYNEDDYE